MCNLRLRGCAPGSYIPVTTFDVSLQAVRFEPLTWTAKGFDVDLTRVLSDGCLVVCRENPTVSLPQDLRQIGHLLHAMG